MKIKSIKEHIKNKKGASGGVMALLVAFALVISGLVAYAVFSKPTQQTQMGGTPVSEGAVIPETVSCPGDEPYLSPAIKDAINPGTAVTGLSYYVTVLKDEPEDDTQYGNVSLGSAGQDFNVGDKLEVLATAANFLDQKYDYTVKNCGVNTFSGKIYATDVSTLQVYNDQGNLLTDNSAGGTTNQTNSTTTITMDGIKISGPSDKSSGDIVVAIESSNDTQVKDITLSGATKIKPAIFKKTESTADDAITRWFEIPAVKDGQTAQYGIIIEPDSGQRIGTTAVANVIYINLYTKEWFTDVDGTFQYGIEDSDGTTQYEDTQDYDFAISFS